MIKILCMTALVAVYFYQPADGTTRKIGNLLSLFEKKNSAIIEHVSLQDRDY